MTFRLALLFLACSGFAAFAADCGPDKLGTSRTLAVGTKGGLMVGLKTYPRTLPLADHELVLTFDDGPDPVMTPKVLDALAAQCVRATFFDIGAKAEANPALVKREAQEGHTIAFHTFTHPQPTMLGMTAEQARADILRGMVANEKAAFGSDAAELAADSPASVHLHAPFFRFPGFKATPDLKAWFAKNDVGIFSTDIWASDWVQMTPEAELKLLMSRIEAAKRGMVLIHDDKPWTTAMLPHLLETLKQRGYKIVDIVSGPDTGPTVDAPAGWRSETDPSGEKRP